MTSRLSPMRRAFLGLLAAGATFAAQAAWPEKPIRMVVAYPAGGSTDVVARALAQKLQERLKQTVVVDNRPGASGMIGSEHVAQSAPDGYTVIFTAADTHSINPHVYTKMRYDAKRDFVPVGMVGYLTMALVVHPSKPATLPQYIDAAKAKPGSFTFASWGLGSSSQVAMEMFGGATRLQQVHVPFQGAAPAMTAVMGGQVDAMMVPLTLAEPNHRAGKVRLLGVAAPKRVPWAADLPTLAEQGVPLDGRLWLGVLAPKGTPADVVSTLNSAINAALTDPALQETMRKNGLEISSGTAQSFASYLDTEFDRWGKTIKDANIRIEQQ
ncbi:MAG TPA: tripartite tricarboxylate transporter substrate binding protein [Ramlibacter sp.]|nr:tripartite tricarboxylate transporter substrate binding protein [Ramlibacter sp.]